jgi:RHS repeat-associated protein
MRNKLGLVIKGSLPSCLLNRFFKRSGLLAVIILLLSQAAFSQISIGGATCVKPGDVYTYILTGNWRPVTHTWCVTNGRIIGILTNCTSGGFSVQIMWYDPGTGELTVRGTDGQASINPTVTAPLEPGRAYTAAGSNINWQTLDIFTVPGTFFCTAPTGGNCGSTYNFQWQSSVGGNTNWTNMAGETGENLSFSAPLSQTTYYRRMVTGVPSNQSGYSNEAAVLIWLPLNGGTINNPSQTINYNTTPGVIDATAATEGNCNNEYTYQWQSSTDNVNFYDIAGANALTYAPGNLTTTTWFRRIASCASSTASSNTAVVNVYPPLQAGSINPSPQEINYNSIPATLTIGGVSGGSGAYSYQWQVSTDGTNFTDIGGATGSGYSPPALTATSYYRVLVNSNGVTNYSATASIIVILPSGGIITPDNLIIAPGTSPGELTANAASGGNCTFTYQWQQSTDGSTWSDVPGATGQNYTPGALNATTRFRRKAFCSATEAYTNICTITVGAITSCDMNYIRERLFTQPGFTSKTTADGITTPGSVKQSTKYFDGMGRLAQTVDRQTSGDLKDIVTPAVYDGFGRETVKYLPYVAEATDGNFRCNPIPEQKSFNSQQYPGEQYYYGLIDYELSPLTRLQGAYSAGGSWVGSSQGKTNKYWTNTITDNVRIWKVNNGTYSNASGDAGRYPAGELFKNVSADEKGNQVIEFKDKDGFVILKKEQLTASPDNGGGSGYTNWLSTYYIYDDLNNLRCVVQPRGVELLAQNNWDFTALNGDILNEQCFRYEYDGRKRMTSKKIPGAGEVHMIYDVRDRLVFTQDAKLQPNNQWLTTLYDDLNRPIITGITTWVGTAVDLQDNVTWQTTYGSTQGVQVNRTLDQPNTSGTYQALQSITMVTNFSTASGADFTAEIVTGGGGSLESTIDGMTVFNNPIPDGSPFEVLTKTGYDTYTTIPAASGLTKTTDNAYTGTDYMLTSYSSFPYPEPVQQSMRTQGLITWTQAKVLGTTNQYLYGVSLYDEEGRLIQAKTKNSTNGTDITTMQYSFNDQVLITVQKQEKAGSSNAQTHIIVTKNNYNVLGKLTSVTKKINSSINGVAVSKPELEIITNQYDVLGRLLKKTVGKKKNGSSYSSDPIQSYTCDYNIRGWLLGVNRNYLATEGQTSDGILFGFELGYDKKSNKAGQSFNNSELNGNIAGMLWKSDGDDIRRKYDFAYDAANRLLRGDFTQQNDDDHQWNKSKVNYDIKMGDGVNPLLAYDANGNILRMQQWGLKVSGSSQIDDLQYSYYKNYNSNKLSAVTDNAPDGTPPTGATGGGLGDFTDKNTAGNDYGYDANGNLVTDLNKRISGTTGLDISSGGAITYNHLNLPQQITIQRDNNNTNKGTVTWVYDATGNKLQKIVKEFSATVVHNSNNYTSDITTTTTYLNEFIYESKQYSHPDLATLNYTDNLKFMNHDEGRLRFIAAVDDVPAHFEYDYFVKDHLGNVRMVLTEEQQQDIYPAATLEGNPASSTEAVYTEKKFYSINDANIVLSNTVTGLSAYKNKNGGDNRLDPPVNNNPYSDATANSQKLYKLKATAVANGGVTGLGITLKVMSGDRIDVFGKSYYFQNNTGGANNVIPVEAIINGIFGTPGGIAGVKGVTATDVNGQSVLRNLINGYISDPGREGGTNTTPKAYINYVLFDENFKYVKGSFDRVWDANDPNAHTVKNHTLGDISVTKNGYLYVYCSNESPVEVYFDNLQVIHTRGPILEETHYYPFGLTMAGISSRAVGKTENKYRYNKGAELQSKEFSDESGLDFYSTFFRSLDPQIGRWWQMDPKIELAQESMTPYVSMANNPVRYNDPLGDVVKINGFTEKEVLDMLSKGLKLNEKTKGLFYFKDGQLQYNKAIYKGLSVQQKKAAKAVIKEIEETKKTFVIAKANNKTVIEPAREERAWIKGLNMYHPDPVKIPAKLMGDHAAITTRSEDKNTVTHYINTEYFENGSTNAKPLNEKCEPIKENPMWLVVFHEIGHGYLRDIVGDPDQLGHAVDLENNIRSMHNFEKRAYDDAHPNPPLPYKEKE